MSNTQNSKLKNWLKRIGIGVGALVVLFVGVGLLLPSEYELQRSIRIKADVEEVHALVGDLKRWDEWTPWQEIDPAQVTTLGVKTTGVGASETWVGEKSSGSLVFTASAPDRGIEYDLDFGADGQCSGSILYEVQGDEVVVTWGMKGDAGYDLVDRYFIPMMESCCGPMFEQGLAKLKTVAERSTAAPAVTDSTQPVGGTQLRPLAPDMLPQ